MGFISFMGERETFHSRILGQGNLKVAYFSTHFSESESFHTSIVGHAYTLLSVIVKGWVSFHSWEGNPLINGNPKVAYFSNHFSESESSHTSIVDQE